MLNYLKGHRILVEQRFFYSYFSTTVLQVDVKRPKSIYLTRVLQSFPGGQRARKRRFVRFIQGFIREGIRTGLRDGTGRDCLFVTSRENLKIYDPVP